MTRAGCGLSEHEDPTEAVLRAVDDAMNEGELSQPSAAFLFATHPHAEQIGSLGRSVMEISGAEHVAGASGTGVLTSAGEVEGRAAVAVLLIESDQIRFRAFGAEDLRGRDSSVAADLGSTLRASRRHASRAPQGEQLLVLFPDTLAFDPTQFFPALERSAGPLSSVGGGATSLFGQAASVHGQSQVSHGLAGVLMQGEFTSRIERLSSARLVSKRMRITRSHDNLLFEFDGLPALVVFQNFAARVFGLDPVRAAQTLFVALYPSGAGEADYVVRSLVGFDPARQVLALSQAVESGDELAFCVLEPQAARRQMERSLEALAAPDGADPLFALYFNCAGRGQGFYGENGVDTRQFRHAFGGVPMAGFFSGAEIAPCAGRNLLHLHTGVLTLVSAA